MNLICNIGDGSAPFLMREHRLNTAFVEGDVHTASQPDIDIVRAAKLNKGPPNFPSFNFKSDADT